MKKYSFLFSALMAMAVIGSMESCSPSKTSEEQAYLFTYFTGQDSGLRLAYSFDGLSWTALEKADGTSFLTPCIGNDRLMRDPSICQGPDGTFHMVWTSSWWDRIIGYASSTDLIHWSEQKSIPVMMHEQDARNSWAPELFYDAPSGEFYIFWATTIPGRHREVAESEQEKGLNHRIYYTTTKDFESFAPTQLFFDQDFSAIDAAIIKSPIDDRLIMTVKNENPNPPQKNIRISNRVLDDGTLVNTLAKGRWSDVSLPIHGDFWAEGPSPLFVHDTLYVYYDCYMNHRYGASRSLDNGKTWEDVGDIVSFPEGMRHGTAFPVGKEVVERLIDFVQSDLQSD